ncbi:MAG: adenosyl-hopene transferase HpnH [Alphaproteobacteria bacterium]|nr:adenosyl-hopene transferase HpnH [Alphaproteobacteria bacterium]
MSVPVQQQIDVGSYIMKQHIGAFFKGNKTPRYPLVLMLEPLFRCNLACAGCGKIDYPDAILNQRLSIQECLDASKECGAPIVVLAGGEPLLHKDIKSIVEGLLAQGKWVTLCTNALLLEKKIDQFTPHPRFNWSVHLDGGKEEHDRSVCQKGVYEKAVEAIKIAQNKNFRVNINATFFKGIEPEKIANFFDDVMALGVNAMTISPGYAYERAPDQEHFLNRKNTKELFRDVFRMGKERVAQGKQKWRFSQSSLFMDFLAGNQEYECTPWGNPTRTVFGWQRPCYLLGEGYASSFKQLMEETEWDKYGTGNYEKCADCMVHSGFEATAVMDSVKNPLKALQAALHGPKTEGEMAPEISLANQRPAEYVFSNHVQNRMAKIEEEAKAKNAALSARSEAAE